MNKAEGIYMSVDYRVSNRKTGDTDDASVKFLTVDYPPQIAGQEHGPRALIAYTGVAFAPDGTPLGDWLKQTMRGQTETFDVSMRHLRSRLDRDFGRWLFRYKEPLIVNVLAIEQDWRFFGGFTNVNADGTIRRSFDYVMQQLTEPAVFSNGSGAVRAVADGHMHELIDRHLGIRPHDPHDHMKLLATVNRRVAAVDSSVSPHCHVAFINAPGYFVQSGPRSETFTEHGDQAVPFSMPTILHGIDLSFMAETFMRQAEIFMKNPEAGPPPTPPIDSDEVNKHLKRRP